MTHDVLNRQGIRIVCADAESIAWPIDIDLIITDPPYGKVYRSSQRGQTSGDVIVGDADQDKIDRIVAACWRRIKPHRHAYVMGPTRDLPNSASADLVWNKQYTSAGPLVGAGSWGRSHEPIQLYVHRRDKSEPNGGTLAAKMRRGTVISVVAGRGQRRLGHHPNEKPVELWRWLIESSSLPGDLIVDPFCGSGSSALAAILSGRRYLGVDIDLGWAERAAERADRLLTALDGALR